jgi:periplasmic divalent cation tolerance protein
MKEIAMFYIPFSSESEATKVGQSLVDLELVACYNIHGIRSGFLWEEQIVEEDEYILVAKTSIHLVQKTTEKVEALHSYDCPCIAHWAIQVNEAYGLWIEQNTKYV